MATQEPAVTFRELLSYADYLAQRWLSYFTEHPTALDIDVGGKTGTIRDLASHIFQAEQFFASRLFQVSSSSAPPPKLESPAVAELERMHQEAHQKLALYIDSATDESLHHTQCFGPRTVSNRKVLTQALLHSIHHWAQVAMEVRQAGFPTEKPQDIIISPVME